ncbi:CPBP family intramembrane glutamic endopeptidase [Uliginosibacterium sp. H3]|uniref:CPBP family intramembrane glutamic endopeptidase n=1 Tax=Uliginosibacterium silvisoli TaxID=3114758 RepID=A0ABU6K0E6_9RHOO|nr:CPBP family intramembrane glutamic endopeptidase [Uliginosibacterium sp. H3]
MLTTASAITFLGLFVSQLSALSGMPWRFIATSFFITLIAGCAAGIVTTPGAALALAGLLLAALSHHLAVRPSARSWRTPCIVLLALLALALGFHAVPGFKPQVLMNDFGRDAAHTLTWHADKGIGGLLLLMACANSPRTRDYRRLIAMLMLCPAVLTSAALLGGIATLDPRWLSGSAMWLLGNLFLTIVAEEVFFRGLLQQRLGHWLQARWACGPWPAIAFVALLFAAVHAPWGLGFAIGAGLAGVLYGALHEHGGLRWAIAGHAISNAALLVLTRSPLG